MSGYRQDKLNCDEGTGGRTGVELKEISRGGDFS